VDADVDVFRDDDEVLHVPAAHGGEPQLSGEGAAQPCAGESVTGTGCDLYASAFPAHDLQLAGCVRDDSHLEAVVQERVHAAIDVGCLGVGGCG
jgi:hypothetical protein